MHQWKEKLERSASVNAETASDILHLLESSESETVQSVQNLIHENLNSTKDSKFLNILIDYYLAVKSKRSFDILIQVKDPHDKHLLDKIVELMKSECNRTESLQLFSNLVYRRPRWLHKIANHRLMTSLLQMLKNDINPMNLMNGVFILVCLLPLIPYKIGQILPDAFEVFSRLAAWSVKKPSSMLDIYIMHLQIGVYSLFHRLYGMFPCNFLAYLHSHYGGRDCSDVNKRIFSVVIKPMLERVKLHPLLVTASKETELSPNRWKKMDYHDIIVDCASISLDAIEGSQEGLKPKIVPLAASYNQNSNSHQFTSIASQGIASVNAESGSLVSNALHSPSSIWSPSHSISVTTPPPIASSAQLIKSEKGDRDSFSKQCSLEECIPLDIAVEAKPESSLSPNKENASKGSSTNEEPCRQETDVHQQKDLSDKQAAISTSQIPTAVEAKEDDTDKEVFELISSQNTTSISSTPAACECTPFCVAPQNLTEESPNPSALMSTTDSTRSDSLTKNNEDASDDMYSSLQDTDTDVFVPAYDQYRYLDQCRQTSAIPTTCAQNLKMTRSVSCPPRLYPTAIMETNAHRGNDRPCENVVTSCNNVVSTTSTFVPVLSSTIGYRNQIVNYEALIPMAMNTGPTLSSAASCRNVSTVLNTLSPPELLDHYIQLGSMTYLSELGNPPPDEVMILRDQIKLLHCQLLFERHRKDVHSERNRSVLGRSKRSKMQEDHIAALEKQVALLQLDNERLKTEVTIHLKLYERLKNSSRVMENELRSKIIKSEQENSKYKLSNMNLQNLLVSQKKENDEIREGNKRNHSETENLRLQLELFSKEFQRYHKVEKEALFLSKQVALLQELNGHYKDKVEQMKQSQGSEIGENLMNLAALIEIRDLKQKLDSKNFIVETSKTKIQELEQMVNSMKGKHKEHLKAFEDVKIFNMDEIKVRDERIGDLRKMSIQKDCHILELNKTIESLSDKIRKLEAKSISKEISEKGPSSSHAEM